MTDNKPNSCSKKVTRFPSKDVTVTDATHPRLRKPMCVCTEEQHETFSLNTVHKHFSKFQHESVDSCPYCGSKEVYGYFLTVDRLEMKIYHDCSLQQPRNTADSVQEHVQNDIQSISNNSETSVSESSGIGTGYCSTVSIFNEQADDGQSTGSSLTKLSSAFSDSVARHNDTLNGSQGGS